MAQLTPIPDLTSKADKVSSPTNGHLAGLDSSGNLTDSGVAASSVSSHIASTSNPHSVTKAQVGLGNVLNALQLVAASNLFDLTNASTARTNLGLGALAVLSAVGDAQVSAGIDASKIGGGAISNTEFGYLDGVTSGIQGQLNAKALSSDLSNYLPLTGGTLSGSLGIGGAATTRIVEIHSVNPYIRLNNTGAHSSLIEYQINGTSVAYAGVAAGTDAIVTGAVVGDYLVRTNNKNVIWSNDNGASAQMKLDASSNLTVTGGGSFGDGVTAKTLTARNGDTSNRDNRTYQIKLGFNGTELYPQWISTRHNGAAAGNAFDFWTGFGGTVFPDQAILGFSIENGSVSTPGTCTAANFSGDGSALTNLTPANIAGANPRTILAGPVYPATDPAAPVFRELDWNDLPGNMPISKLTDFPGNSEFFLRGDGAWSNSWNQSLLDVLNVGADAGAVPITNVISVGGVTGNNLTLGSGADAIYFAVPVFTNSSIQVLDDSNAQTVLITNTGTVTAVSFVGDGSSLTNIAPANIAGYPGDAAQYLRGDGAWGTPPSPTPPLVNVLSAGNDAAGISIFMNGSLGSGGGTIYMDGGTITGASVITMASGGPIYMTGGTLYMNDGSGAGGNVLSMDNGSIQNCHNITAYDTMAQIIGFGSVGAYNYYAPNMTDSLASWDGSYFQVFADTYYASGTAGWSGTYATGDGRTVTVSGGIITNVS